MYIRSLLLLCIFAGLAIGQQNRHKFHGTVSDPQGAVIGGLRLMFKSGEKIDWAVTDVNGDFAVLLDPGNYKVTADPAVLNNFVAYLKISAEGLNPDGVMFTIDRSKVCCRTKTGDVFPKATSLPKPPYPPAARAVRASGEVVVAVKINNDGVVTSAAALSGHPLLRRAAEAAARGARFEMSAVPTERDANLTYFFMTEENEKPGLRRFDNAFRIHITAMAEVVDASNVRTN